MIHYSCKYAPIELFAAFGEEACLLDREEENFERAEALTHANLCCHAKSLIQQSLDKRNVIIMDCCDSLRRVYDVLDFEGNQEHLYLLDLPHENNGCARELFAGILLNLVHDLERSTGRPFNTELFIQACAQASWEFPQEDFIALLGGRVSPELEASIAGNMSLPIANLTCCGSRGLEPLPEGAQSLSLEELMDWYAHALLRMVPCMRMTDVSGRRVLFENPYLKGIIYNTVKFCDFYSFDYSALKDETDLPMLKIESDYMPMAQGQLSTRLEAFSESLGLDARQQTNEKVFNMQGTYYAGIDSGSTTRTWLCSTKRAQWWQALSCAQARRPNVEPGKRSKRSVNSLAQPKRTSQPSWLPATGAIISRSQPTRRPRSAAMRMVLTTSIPRSVRSWTSVGRTARSSALMKQARSRTSS